MKNSTINPSTFYSLLHKRDPTRRLLPFRYESNRFGKSLAK